MPITQKVVVGLEPKQETIQHILNELHKWKQGAELFAEQTLETQQRMVQEVLAELDNLRVNAEHFTVQQIQNGDWFNQFIRSMLANYAQTILEGGGITLFRTKYPGLTRDQIAQKMCDLATQYAAIAGGSSGALSSAAFAATIGTAGGAGVVAVPAGIAIIVAEMLYTTRLQIRLVYDLSIIYGYPINLDDPKDLYKAFAMAYGVTFVSGNLGTAIKTFTPEIARSYIRGLIHGHTQAIQHVAMRVIGPRLGRKITQRAILRTAVLGVSIAISAGWNYLSTQHIATAARYELRTLGRLRDAVQDVSSVLQTSRDEAPLVVECMLVVITADKTFDPREQELFNQVIKYLDVPVETLRIVEGRVDIVLDSVEQRLQNITDTALREALVTCIQLVAVADGKLHRDELPVVQRLLGALGHELDKEVLRETARTFERPNDWMDNLTRSLVETAGQSGPAVEGIRRWFTERTGVGKDVVTEEVAPAVSVQQVLQEIDQETSKAEDTALQEIRQITALHTSGKLSDAAFAARVRELSGAGHAET